VAMTGLAPKDMAGRIVASFERSLNDGQRQ
jgi:hypothetical protein